MTRIEIDQKISADNDRIAAELRQYFDGRNILALNILASPGAGKTTLIERTCAELKGVMPVAVIEGDLASDVDTARLLELGVNAYQINTDGMCHLNANLLQNAVDKMTLEDNSLLLIENVGNLVCPADVSLGEHKKVLLLSVPEGHDKPQKYPQIFKEADLLIVTKSDMLGFGDFSLDALKGSLATLKPDLPIVVLSAKTGENFEMWIDWLKHLTNS